MRDLRLELVLLLCRSRLEVFSLLRDGYFQVLDLNDALSETRSAASRSQRRSGKFAVYPENPDHQIGIYRFHLLGHQPKL